MKKIVAFVGSGRKDGYCAQTVRAIKKGAETKGAEVTVYTLNDLDIKPCRGCRYCREGKGCSITDDDMSKIYADLKNASGIVFATPIYFGCMSGQSLTLIDRLYPLAPPKETKKTVAVFAHMMPGKNAYRSYIDSVSQLLKAIGMDVQKTIVCSGTKDMPEAERAEIMKEAFETGKELG